MAEKEAFWIAKDRDGERVVFLDGEPTWKSDDGTGWWEHTGRCFSEDEFYGSRAFAEPLFDMLPWDELEDGQALPVPFLIQHDEIVKGGADG